MKKIVLGIIVGVTMLGVTSCGDDELKSIVSDIVEKVEKYTTKLDKAKGTIMSAEDNLKNLKTETDTVLKELKEAKGDAAKKAAQEKVAIVKGKVQKMRTDLIDAKKIVDDVLNDVNSLDIEDEATKRKVEELKGKLGDATQKYNETMKELDGLTASLTAGNNTAGLK